MSIWENMEPIIKVIDNGSACNIIVEMKGESWINLLRNIYKINWSK